MISNEDKTFRKQLLGSLNNIGTQLKRLADIQDESWREVHHNYMEDEDDDCGRDENN